MQRPITPIPIAWLLISLVAAGGVLAQQAPTSVPLSIPPGPVTHLPTRYDVTDAPSISARCYWSSICRLAPGPRRCCTWWLRVHNRDRGRHLHQDQRQAW
jgi:hypothetical protein